MVFGDKVVKGIAAAKQFFVTFDTPFKTVHNVTGVWQVGNAFVMQGSADTLKKGSRRRRRLHVASIQRPLVRRERQSRSLRCDLPAWG